ncbi:MAG: LacI family DNA-binding transcriptional regulator [Limnochordaceae bacterium]|nr:LacI family DNA-binding transcriptional regulator [Limnochordaceae bacterium]
MAGIREVAEAAGVAVSTVSKVLNRPEFGSPETRQRVIEAARRLNYRPHAIARSLVSRHTESLGLVIPDLMNPVFPTVARAVERAAREEGYSLVLGATDRTPAVERQYQQLFLENKADGVIFFAALEAGNVRALREQGVPIVVIERPSSLAEVDYVGVDNRLGGYLATRHLLEQGCRRVGLIVGPLPGEVEEQRLAGYRQALAEAGIEFRDQHVVTADYTVEAGREATARLLDQWPGPGPRPDGLFVGCDILAIGALRELAARGIDVPGQMMVIGFDDTLSQFTTPALSTVAQPFEELGRQAVRLLLDRIRHPEHRCGEHMNFEPRLVIRESTQRR